MTPIEKNVIVTDENGNIYEATHPKRARGLVKNGRARFIDDNKICLTCPPDTYLEDKMKNSDKTEKSGSKALPETPEAPTRYNIDYCLEQIESIRRDTEHLRQALEDLSKIPNSPPPGDIGAEGRSEAIKGIVESREATNRQMIAFYEKMYDDLKPKNIPGKGLLEELKAMSKDSMLSDEMRELANDRINELIMDMYDAELGFLKKPSVIDELKSIITDKDLPNDVKTTAKISLQMYHRKKVGNDPE